VFLKIVTEPLTPTVRRRHVFYVPGYDPMPPRRYRELYRVEGKKQAKISGYELSIKGSTGQNERYHWLVNTQIDGAETDTRIEFLRWNDIVFDSMRNSIPQTYWLLLKTLWLYVSSGTLGALGRLRRAPILAAMYPVVVLVGQVAFSVFLGKILGEYIGGVVGLSLGVGFFYLMLVLFRRFDKHFFAYYLLHDFAFWAQDEGAMPEVLGNRVSKFCDRICEALDSDVDEVLIIGHSSGAHLAVVLAAEVLRRRDNTPTLALLTLGQAIPVTSFLPAAWDLRRDLQQISMREDIKWLDVSAPGDGACFALSDPVSVSGVALSARKYGPTVISAAFSQTLSAESQSGTRWRFLRRHIQYLCAFDYPVEYDYFKITAGPVSLKARFAHRSSTASVIEKVYSPHTSVEVTDG